jgi:outer membrane lipopolysaccharide assembly protein LptE/RlpB
MPRLILRTLMVMALLSGLAACDHLLSGPAAPMQHGGGDAPGDLPD